MSSRIRTIIITLETNVHEDYVDEHLIPALKLFPGVLKVDREVADAEAYFALENARHALIDELMKVLFPSKE
jgi:hypothetical protein